MKVIRSKVVRFARLVEASGKPKILSLWREPRKDEALMEAVRNHRVLTVKQPATGNARDWGIIGFHPEKDAAYLKFPKALPNFENQRVIGINYDLIEDQVQLEPGAGIQAPGANTRSGKTQKTSVSKQSAEAERTFRVRIRASSEVEVDVTAPSKRLAGKAALEKSPAVDFSKTKIARKIVALKEIKKRGRSLA